MFLKLNSAVLSAIMLSACHPAAHGAWIKPVGVMDSTVTGAYSRAAAISPDGEWVVGESRGATGVIQPFRWSQDSGMMFLGNPSGSSSYATGVAVKSSGEMVIAGNIGGIGRRWSSTTGTWAVLPPSSLCRTADTNALGLSADGNDAWIVGSEDVRGGCGGGTLYIGGYLYNLGSGTRTGPIQAAGSKVYFNGIATDGTAAGFERTSGNDRAVYWPGLGPAIQVTCLADRSGQARGISSDGRYLVGQVTIDGLIHAFRWEVGAADYEDLGALILGEHAYALAADGRGRIVGGYSLSTARPAGEAAQATIWDGNGIHRLADLLAAEGVDLPGWTALSNVRSISTDGRTICGDGLYDLDGDGPAAAIQMGYVAMIPEPSTMAMFGLIFLLLRKT